MTSIKTCKLKFINILIVSLIILFCSSSLTMASDDAIEGGDSGLSSVETSAFNDIPRNAWYRYFVEDLSKRGVLNGFSDGSYKPNQKITRAATAVTLYRSYAGAYGTIGSSPFTDVSNSHWAKTEITWAAKKGIVNGVGNNKFEPDNGILRQDFAVMIVRYCNSAELFTIPVTQSKSNFRDHSSISSYAVDAVYKLQKAGIISGDGNKYFHPKSTITRAEAAKIISAIIKRLSATVDIHRLEGRIHTSPIPVPVGYMCYSTLKQHYRKTNSHITFYDVENTLQIDDSAASLGILRLNPGGFKAKVDIKFNNSLVKEQKLNYVTEKANSSNPNRLAKASYPAKKFSSSGTYKLTCPASFGIENIEYGGISHFLNLEHNRSYTK